MIDLKRLRAGLTVLADRLPLYSDLLRHAGFSCCHIDDDWIQSNCARDDLSFHRRYLIEFAREAIASDSPSKILYSDEPNCRSGWLNELKTKRLTAFGPEDKLFASSSTRHLVELSPCQRELSRIRERPDQAAAEADDGLVREFENRWQNELQLHRERIDSLKVAMGKGTLDEAYLQEFYAAQMAEAFAFLGARLIPTVQRYGPELVVSISLGKEIEFVLVPTITCSERPGNEVTSGKVGMGYRLAFFDALRSGSFDKSKYEVLHLYSLFPKELMDYGRFSNSNDFCLNVLARIAALKHVVPDVVRELVSYH